MKQHEVLCVLYFSSCTQLHAISLVAAQNSFETFECHYEFQKEHEIFSFKWHFLNKQTDLVTMTPVKRHTALPQVVQGDTSP